MSDFNENNLVVQANSLIQQTNWKMNTIPLKIFKVLISCINTKNPPKDNRVRIEKKELYKLINADNSENSHNYTFLKNQVKSLQSHIIELKTEDGLETLSIVPNVYWKKDYIECVFNNDLMPYLIELKERFTQYPVYNLTAFKSKYSIIIYEYLMSERYKQENPIVILMDDLRYITGTQNKYNLTKYFEKNVLIPAVEDINNNPLEFLVKYQKIGTKGKKITAIHFYIRDRISFTEKNYDIIERPQLFKIDNSYITNEYEDDLKNN